MLLLDLGNSAIKGQWWSDGELCLSFTCLFQTGWQSRLVACLADIGAKRCYLSSVQDDQVECEITSLLEGYVEVSKPISLVASKKCCGVTTAYQEPSSLGTDRWLNLLGASSLVQLDAIIVDVGSAITIDLLRADGQHLGGAILPGFNTSIDQFKRIMRHANFDHAVISHTDEPGCFTEACINIDYDTTDTGIVEQLVDRWSGRLTSNAVTILTGGGAICLHEHLSRENRLAPDLLFRGMRRQFEDQ